MKTTKKIKLSELHPNARNPRKIDAKAFETLCNSIKRDPEFMALRPIVVDESNTILAGTQRHAGCVEIGMTEVPSEWVIVARDLTPEKRKRFQVLDNVSAGEFDWDMLEEDWDIPELEKMGFTEKEICGGFSDLKREFSAPPQSVSDTAEKIADIKKQRKEGNESVASANDTERYLVIIFGSREERERACAQLGLPKDERYVSSDGVKLTKGITVNAIGKKAADAKNSGSCG